MRQRIGWIALCAVLLVVLGRFTFAQAQRAQVSPQTVTSADLRFVVQETKNGLAAGYFEARINGNWMRVQPVDAPGPHLQPLMMR